MAIKVGDVFVKVGFDTSDFDRNLKGIGQKMGKVGKDLSMKVTAPLAIFGALSIKTAADFSKSMAKVNAVTGATSDEFAALNAQAKDLGATTQFTATQVSEAMKFMGMAGQDTVEIMEGLPATLNLAAAGTLDMATAANISTNILAGFGMEVSELGMAVDVLSKAFTSSNVDLIQLGDSMKFAGPVAKGFGLSFAETTAIMGSFGNAGIQGSLAGTSLRGAIVQLDKKAQKFGITMRDTTGKMMPMADILEQLEKTGITTSEAMELFGLRAGPAMVALLDTGSDALRQFTAELEASGGTAEQIAKTQMEGLHGALIILQSAFESLQIAIAEILTPILTPLIDKLTKAFRQFDKLPGPIKTTAVVVGILAASIGPLLIALSLMIKGYLAAKTAVIALQVRLIALKIQLIATKFALATMLGPLALAVTLIAGAVAAFVLFGNKAKLGSDEIRKMGQSLKDLSTESIKTKQSIKGIEEQISELAEKATPDAIDQLIILEDQLHKLHLEAKKQEEQMQAEREALEQLLIGWEAQLKAHEQFKDSSKENAKLYATDARMIAEVRAALMEEEFVRRRLGMVITNDGIRKLEEERIEREKYLQSIGQTEESLSALEQRTRDASREQGVMNSALGIAQDRLDTATDRFNTATEAVAEFERKIADANREIKELSAPRLEGMQDFEDELFAIDQQILPLEKDLILARRAMNLMDTEGLTGDALKRAQDHNKAERKTVQNIQDRIDELREEQELLRINAQITYDPLTRSLTEAGEEAQGLNKELELSAIDDTLTKIAALGTQLDEYNTKLAEAKDLVDIEEKAMEFEQSIVDHFTAGVKEADRQLAWLNTQSEGHANDVIAQAQAAAAAWHLVNQEMTASVEKSTPKPTIQVPVSTGNLTKNFKGGKIPGPTGLFDLKTRKFYGTAGEKGSETILPHGAGGGPTTLVVERLQLNIDGGQLVDVLGEVQVAAIRRDQGIKF